MKGGSCLSLGYSMLPMMLRLSFPFMLLLSQMFSVTGWVWFIWMNRIVPSISQGINLTRSQFSPVRRITPITYKEYKSCIYCKNDIIFCLVNYCLRKQAKTTPCIPRFPSFNFLETLASFQTHLNKILGFRFRFRWF